MSEIKNGGLDQYGAVPFEQQQFGTAGVEGLSYNTLPLVLCPFHYIRSAEQAQVVDSDRPTSFAASDRQLSSVFDRHSLGL